MEKQYNDDLFSNNMKNNELGEEEQKRFNRMTLDDFSDDEEIDENEDEEEEGEI